MQHLITWSLFPRRETRFHTEHAAYFVRTDMAQ